MIKFLVYSDAEG